MSSSIGIAILGAGIFAKEAYIPSLAAIQNGEYSLKAVYSRSERSALELSSAAVQALNLSSPPTVYHDGSSESSNLDGLLARSDISAVIVVLPITLQPSIIIKALEAGKHVLSEKPVAPDVEQGISLIRTYKEKYQPKGLIWRVAENFETEPGFRAAVEAVRNGKIGRVIQFKAIVENCVTKETKYYKTAWRTVPDYQGGFLLDGGVHTAAVLRTVIPHPITQISSFASLNKEYLVPHDTIHAIIQAGPQIQGTLSMTFAWPTKSKTSSESFVFTGTKGWLSITNAWGTVTPAIRVKIVTKKSDEADGEETEEVVEEPCVGVRMELESFLAAINGRDTLGVGDPVETLRDVAFIQAALNSNGALVDVHKLVPEDL